MRLNINFLRLTDTRLFPMKVFLGLVWVILMGISGISRADQDKRSSFFDIQAGLTGVAASSVAWGDYNNDGFLDILLTGFSSQGRITRVYRSNGGFYQDIGAGLLGVMYSSVAWGDYDKDGDLDILLTGYSGSGYHSIVYRNDAGIFTDIGAGLAPVGYSAVAWGDYDNDGDLDILLTGYSEDGFVTQIYRNHVGTFYETDVELPAVGYSTVAWGDYDNDGDLDILLAGDTGTDVIAKVFRNDGGRFADIEAGLTGVKFCSGAWGDYDNDGDLDILLTGDTVYNHKAKIYRNDDGSFVDLQADLPDVDKASVGWGDYDNDGDLDILMAGLDLYQGRLTRIYRNDEGNFVDAEENFPGVDDCAVAWGDFENDGKLDLLLTGYEEYGSYLARVYRNGGSAPNSPPTAPVNLTTRLDGLELTLYWDPATDSQTPPEGLTYNLRVGTTPGGSEILDAMSDPSGYRKIVAMGNANHNTAWTINLSPPVAPVYYWSLQAIDTAFRGSPFAEEQMHHPMSPVGAELGAPAFALLDNVPNPFNPRTTIIFELPRSEAVHLRVFDVSGRLVRTLLKGEHLGAGQHRTVWQGKDEAGRPVPAGIYLYTLEAGGFSETKRMMLVK
jgi:hypothetical protein